MASSTRAASSAVTHSGGLIFTTLCSRPQSPTTIPRAKQLQLDALGGVGVGLSRLPVADDLGADQEAAPAHVAQTLVARLQLPQPVEELAADARALACRPSSAIARRTARPAAQLVGLEP